MAKTKHGLQETTGQYQGRGIVTGTEKESFYKEIKTKTNKDMRLVNFGIEIEKNKSVHLNLSGMVKKEVVFSKRNEDKTTTIKKVDWDKRLTFKEEGFQLIGVNLGLEKDAEGKNIKGVYSEFDGCKKINDNLEDGLSVFTKCKIEYGSYQDGDSIKRTTKLVPQQISLTSKDIDFSSEDFSALSAFSQQIVFNGIEKNEDGTFTVSAKIVTYDSIEDTEFTIKNDENGKNLANLFRKNLKPYYAIQVHGHVEVTENVSTVEDSDTWGESDPTQRVGSPTKTTFVITGAKGSSVDKETYTKEKIEEAMKKIQQSETAQQDWGSSDNAVNDAEDAEW